MIHRTVFAASCLLVAAACGSTPTEAPLSRAAAAQRDDVPPADPPVTQPAADTTGRGGGGTIGSGT